MARSYIEFIDESVKVTKENLETNELLHYLEHPDKPDINGNKVEDDELKGQQIYQISVYSALLIVQERLHKLKDTGSVKPAMIGYVEPKDTPEISFILGDDKAAIKDLEKLIERLKKGKK